MKRLSAILLALPLVLCGACSEEEETLPQQRERIVSYLTATHSPTLVDESEVLVRNRTNISLCRDCLRVTIGTRPENDMLLEALTNYEC